MGFFQNVNAYRIGECRTSADKKHLYMYEKTGWREVAGTRRKKQWIDTVNNKVYMKSRRGFWNAYEDKIYIRAFTHDWDRLLSHFKFRAKAIM